MNTLGWFEVFDSKKHDAPRYSPPDWEEHRKEENEFLKAERIRLKYVALTRAEDEAHVFTLHVEETGKKPRNILAWKGFDAVGNEAPQISVTEAAPVEKAEDPELSGIARREQQLLRSRLSGINSAVTKRITPSDQDRNRLQSEPMKIEVQAERNADETWDSRPGGTSWGSVVHRAAELVVHGKAYSAADIEKAAEQAVAEQFPSELLSDRDRRNLLLPKEAVTLRQIHRHLTEKVCDRLGFMSDPNSAFRKLLENAVCYPELPFVVSVSKEDGGLFGRLTALSGIRDESRIEISGKIDLALRYPDGTWRILDYKTDRMLPIDGGSQKAFHERLNTEYGTQLETYKAVLENVTGESVLETILISV